MNRLKRRFANFIDVDESERTVHSFNIFSELKEVDWIKNITEKKGFKRFSVYDRKLSKKGEENYEKLDKTYGKKVPRPQPILMSEYEDGSFWGVGFFDSNEGLEELPDCNE